MEFLIGIYMYIQQPLLWERVAVNDVPCTNCMHVTHLDPVNNE